MPGGARSRVRCAHGAIDVPEFLDQPVELDANWRDPRLLLSQACSYPLVTTLRSRVQVVGAMHYTAPGCSGLAYRIEVIARIDDARNIDGSRGRVAAINSPDSHSGCYAVRGLVAPLARNGTFFADQLICGSHRRSLAALHSGRGRHRGHRLRESCGVSSARSGTASRPARRVLDRPRARTASRHVRDHHARGTDRAAPGAPRGLQRRRGRRRPRGAVHRWVPGRVRGRLEGDRRCPPPRERHGPRGTRRSRARVLRRGGAATSSCPRPPASMGRPLD